MWVINGDHMTPLLLNPRGTPWHSMQYQALPEVYVQNASLEIAWSHVVFEPKSLAAKNLVRSKRRADILFDMLDYQIVAAEVTHMRPAFWVVHRIGHVAHEDDILAVLGHLPQAKGTAQDAHVGMDAEQDDVANAALLQKVPNLDA